MKNKKWEEVVLEKADIIAYLQRLKFSIPSKADAVSMRLDTLDPRAGPRIIISWVTQ